MNKISKLFITYGPGSVGSIAKWMAKNYTIAKKKFPEKSHRELLLYIIEARYPDGKAIIGPERLPESKEKIIEKCHESLEEITIYIIHTEHKELDEILIKRPSLYRDVIGVIRETLNRFLPNIKDL